MATRDGAGESARPTTSTRQLDALTPRLEAWLTTQVSPGASPRVSNLHVPAANGMSSETVLFDAAWRDADGDHYAPLVARLAPEDGAVPVFPVYDLHRQFQVMDLVHETSSVPVPRVFWSEPDAAFLGTAFFIMERVSGDVPPDVMPYNFGSWLSEASPEQQSRLQDSSVGILVQLHNLAATPQQMSFLAIDSAEPTALGRHVAAQWSYYQWVAGGLRSPLLEACFKWLEDHWPAFEGPAALSWGDARIGNMMFRQFEPVAVLDWEMAGLAPPEVDLAWFIFLHRFFEDLAEQAGLAGMPGFLRRDDVAGRYEALSGYEPRDLDFYTMYAALRHGIVMSRVMRRSIHFGEATMPDDIDDLILHRATLEAMLADTYWSARR